MSRVINPNGPGKARSHLMRTSAEAIRRLGEKQEMDLEARDLAALLVYCFREIDEGIDDSVRAWEKRDYWVKAERFRARWSWARPAANQLEQVIINEEWDRLPLALIEVLPHFEDITIGRYTRQPSLWKGAYQRLINEQQNGKGA